jgi:hypothetical protein
MDIAMIGLIAAIAWGLLLMIVLGSCMMAARADALADYSHANDRGRARERVRARERMRPAAL